MKLLGMRHLFIMFAACLALGTTMVGCGDDTSTPAVDSGVDAGGNEAGTGGKPAVDSGTAGTTAIPDAGTPGEDGGEDGGADAG